MRPSLLEHALRAAALAAGLGVASVAACSYPRYGFAPAAQDSALDEAVADTGVTPAADTTDEKSHADAGADSARKDSAPPPDTAVEDTTDAAVADTAECPILLGGDACAKIPRFTAPKQLLDGAGREFCDVLASSFNASTGAHPLPTPPPTGLDTNVVIRAAWSPEALHVHVHVDQAKVFSPTPVEEVWHGDAIELFVSGSAMLTGPYGGTDDPALQAIASPDQSPSSPARALIYRMGTYESVLGPSAFATRMVPGGYEIELEIPWSQVGAVPVSGGSIGFDLGVDVRETGDAPGPELQTFLGYRPSVASTACPRIHPSCDDRTWCIAKLE